MNQEFRLDIRPLNGPVANAFALLINALFLHIQEVGHLDQYPKDASDEILNNTRSYDFIIVGGGAAGCAVANKLTEIDSWSVLVLEAGGYPSSTTDIPGFYSIIPFTEEDWAFKVQKSPKSCLAKKTRNCYITKGKVLGGTSAVNNMIYVRGIPEHINQWNFPEWNGTVVHELLHTLEGVFPYNITVDSTYEFGYQGGVHLEAFNYTNYLKDRLIDSYKYAGMAEDKRKYIRLTHHYVYAKQGERFNMAEAFLSPIKDRTNFNLSLHSEVMKLNMAANNDSRIQSVEVKIKDKVLTIRAKKEIILTAGAINNAKLLLLSGIGPKDYLKSKKIPVVANLPGVGKNLQLHVNVPLFVGVTKCVTSNTTEANVTEPECTPDVYTNDNFLKDVYDFIMTRRGNLTNIDLNDIVVYMYTKKQDKKHNMFPNIGIYHNYFRINDRNMENLFSSLQFNPAIVRSLQKYNQERSIVMFSLSLLRPYSVGEVQLNECSTDANPKITSNFFTSEQDLITLIEAYEIVKDLIENSEFSSQNASVLHLDIPNCRYMKVDTEKYARCYVMNMAFPNSDVAGTTKLSYPCDPDMVVDKMLEVRGIRCLRVGDSSILPNITIGNPVSTDIMLGYRLAEILKAKWLKNYTSEYSIPGKVEKQEE